MSFNPLCPTVCLVRSNTVDTFTASEVDFFFSHHAFLLFYSVLSFLCYYIMLFIFYFHFLHSVFKLLINWFNMWFKKTKWQIRLLKYITVFCVSESEPTRECVCLCSINKDRVNIFFTKQSDKVLRLKGQSMSLRSRMRGRFSPRSLYIMSIVSTNPPLSPIFRYFYLVFPFNALSYFYSTTS